MEGEISLADSARAERRLKESLTALEECIEALEASENDYLRVGRLLSELPKKARHHVVIPMGAHAFFMGELRNTNEVMVHLGGNRFAQRTVSNALRTVEERQLCANSTKKEAGKKRDKLQQEISILNAVPQVLPDGKGAVKITPEGFVEIIEKVDEDEESVLVAEAPPAASTEALFPPRPISKFKASRMKQPQRNRT